MPTATTSDSAPSSFILCSRCPSPILLSNDLFTPGCARVPNGRIGFLFQSHSIRANRVSNYPLPIDPFISYGHGPRIRSCPVGEHRARNIGGILHGTPLRYIVVVVSPRCQGLRACQLDIRPPKLPVIRLTLKSNPLKILFLLSQNTLWLLWLSMMRTGLDIC